MESLNGLGKYGVREAIPEPCVSDNLPLRTTPPPVIWSAYGEYTHVKEAAPLSACEFFPIKWVLSVSLFEMKPSATVSLFFTPNPKDGVVVEVKNHCYKIKWVQHS